MKGQYQIVRGKIARDEEVLRVGAVISIEEEEADRFPSGMLRRVDVPTKPAPSEPIEAPEKPGDTEEEKEEPEEKVPEKSRSDVKKKAATAGKNRK